MTPLDFTKSEKAENNPEREAKIQSLEKAMKKERKYPPTPAPGASFRVKPYH